MKTWQLIVLILVTLIVLVVGGYFLFFQNPTTQPTTPLTATTLPTIPSPEQLKSPSDFASAFYIWYLKGIKNNINFISSAQFKNSEGQWLTPDFINNWQTIINTTEADPVLLVQDVAPSWFTNIEASIIDQSSTASDVEVSLGTGSQLYKLKVHLVYNNGQWLISSVSAS